jgi:hypothetical protein
VPECLEVLAIVSLAVGGLSAVTVVIDLLRGHPQHMWIMDLVWPLAQSTYLQRRAGNRIFVCLAGVTTPPWPRNGKRAESELPRPGTTVEARLTDERSYKSQKGGRRARERGRRWRAVTRTGTEQSGHAGAFAAHNPRGGQHLARRFDPAER